MSLGYEGVCKLVDQDNELAIYAYSGADWANPAHRNHIRDYDGIILIYKQCLEEPEIHTRMQRRSSGRKYESIKIITHIPDINKHIMDGNIIIDRECKNAIRRGSGSIVDYIAHKLLLKIFVYYQEKGVLPEIAAFVQ
jgi:hypothetical protein